ncbi:MAG: iron-only hydrogenase system regulator [Victivallales bacterium]|nr:iron-only hydrogenase system regulator [Victivallales bacterium]
MEKRIALIGIIVEDIESSVEINRILHEYREYLVGRMGIPYKAQNVAIISVVLDAPADITSSLAGKLGMLPGISVKTVYSKK